MPLHHTFNNLGTRCCEYVYSMGYFMYTNWFSNRKHFNNSRTYGYILLQICIMNLVEKHNVFYKFLLMWNMWWNFCWFVFYFLPSTLTSFFNFVLLTWLLEKYFDAAKYICFSWLCVYLGFVTITLQMFLCQL